MRYFFDTEFIENGKTIDLLSIGIVAEDGREFYLENLSADVSKADAWVRENVFPHLDYVKHGVAREEIAPKLIQFIGADPKPQFWAYYAAYDWVVLCQLFGRMIDLPKEWPMFCMDLKQWAVQLGDPELPKQEEAEHNALADARWNAMVHKFLSGAAR